MLVLISAVILSCEQDDSITPKVAVPSFELQTGTEIRLNKAEIDALLLSEFGYIASDYEAKFGQIEQLVHKKLGIKSQPIQKSGLNGCLLITRDRISTGRRFLRGKVCDTDDLVLNAVAFFVTGNRGSCSGPDCFDGEVLTVGTDFRAFVNADPISTSDVIFSGQNVTIARQIDANNADDIGGWRTTGGMSSCNGDGVAFTTLGVLQDNDPNDGEVDFRIDISRSCDD